MQQRRYAPMAGAPKGPPEIRTEPLASSRARPQPQVAERADRADRALDVAVERAVDTLSRAAPEFSAGRRMWGWQFVSLALAAGGLFGAVLSAPELTGRFVLLLSCALFAVVAGYRLLMLCAATVAASRCYGERRRPLNDGELPTYSVLVPLYDEAAVLPDLVEALAGLDYPAAKLDVVLILEAADSATRQAAARQSLPAFMRVVVVPDRAPRTKPKALNTALTLTDGALIVVYDAEDIPAADQLRKAAAAFARGADDLVCVQARLAIHNPRQSWLTRQFALEYATLFHALLPALRCLGMPIPLSGTSNHFRRQALEPLAWDPFNVTEDADLGIRLTRRRGQIGLIDSETLEEAPPTWQQWLPQRTRWIKGWMQTYLVHTRQPRRLAGELGGGRLIGFHALIGGFLLSVLAYPWLFILMVVYLAGGGLFKTEPGTWHHLALTVALLDLIAGVAAALLMLMLGAWRGRLAGLAGDVFWAPCYWLLISVAGYRALAQLIWRPFLWEKTSHAARRRSGGTGRRGR